MSDPIAAPAEPEIDILLATWNSARWLEPLLDSLLAQTVQDFRLIVSDDCSKDETVEILERYRPRFRHPVTLIRRETPSGTAAANFASLMKISRAAYVFLCDGDDVWYPEKLEKFVTAARGLEAEHGPQTPVFVFSDTEVIDGAGHVTHESYWAFKNTDAFRCLSLERILFYGPMLGCACLMNRELTRLAADVPVGRVAGHDWWIALVAASLGVVDAIPDKTIGYRIHGGNNSQPKQVSVGGLAKLGKPFHEVRRRLAIRIRQAEPLLEQFGDKIPADRRKTIERFIAVRNRSFLGRRFALWRYGFRYPDPLRNTALFLFC